MPVIIVSFLGNVGMTTIGIGLIASIVMAYLGYRVVKGIITPIGRLVVVTDKLAAGDLDADIDTGSKSGELGQVNNSLAKMVANIKDRIQYSESILKGIMDPLYVVDPTGRITYINEPGAKLFGASVQELTGKSLEDQFNIAETRSGDSYLTRCLRSGEVRNGFESMLVIKRTGKKITARCSIAPIRDASGRITGAVELLQDISQIKEAEEAMRKAEREMKDKAAFSDGVLKSIRDNHVVIDTSANDHLHERRCPADHRRASERGDREAYHRRHELQGERGQDPGSVEDRPGHHRPQGRDFPAQRHLAPGDHQRLHRA